VSMLSSTCDRLRERAKALRQGRWSDGAEDAKMMELAADTICGLSDKLTGMVDESERARVAEAENAKLRELVRDMWCVMWACAEQRCARRTNRCYRVRGNSDDVRGDGECWFEDRMRELGIEVDV